MNKFDHNLSPGQRDLRTKDKLQIQYQKFKIAKITQDRARVGPGSIDPYGVADGSLSPNFVRESAPNPSGDGFKQNRMSL